MNSFPEHILLDGKQMEVCRFLDNSYCPTEFEWIDFLREWYNCNSYIEVKTSGSTGEPKTIQLAKTFVAESAARTINFFGLQPGDSVLHCLSVRYIAGKLMVVRALLGTLDLHVVTPDTNFDFLLHNHHHFAAMVPNQVMKILDSENGVEKLERIENLLIGGSSIPFVLEVRLKGIQTRCYSSYGMTETATHIALRKVNGQIADSFYHCLEGIHVSISSDGRLQILMPGLCEQPLQTNDLAEVINPKTFRILGRADNVIVSGGIKYSPEQIEKKLEGHVPFPFMITSKSDNLLGQKIVLLIETEEQESVTKQFKDLCATILDRYEQPREILFISTLPRTENGKLKRK